MEPCPYRQGEPMLLMLIDRLEQGRNGALPLSAGREVPAAAVAQRGYDAAMEPCPYRQGECESYARFLDEFHVAAMEPCPYRQGELGERGGDGEPLLMPQWSPALIGRESRTAGCRDAPGRRCRNGALPLSAGRAERRTHLHHLPRTTAAMEPCPYRQGEHQGYDGAKRHGQCRNGALPLSAGRASGLRRCETTRAVPQWSPALIGRESALARRRVRPSGRRRNGALPLSAGRDICAASTPPTANAPQWSPALIGRESHLGGHRAPAESRDAAMEPCPYRQGEGNVGVQ